MPGRDLTFVVATLLLIQTPVFADCVSNPWTGAGSTVTTPCNTVQVGAGQDPPWTVGSAFYAASPSGNIFFTARDSAADIEAVLGVAAPYGGVIGTRSNHDLYFQTNSNNPMILKTSGRLGIGTTTPDAPLHVVGSTAIQGFPTTMLVGSATTPSKRLMFGYDAANEYGFIASEYDGLYWTPLLLNPVSGKVGVGTTSPIRRLDIEDDSDVGGSQLPAVRIGTKGPAYGGSGGAIELAAWNNRGASDPVGKIAAWLTNGAAGQQSGDLVFYTSNGGAVIERMRILADGRIGLNASAPSTTLDVGGNIHASGSITGGTVIGATYQDVAEWVPASEPMPAGTVVIVDGNAHNGVAPSKHAYDTAVAGVISAQPGVLLGAEGPSKAKVATTGRVKVRVDASRTSIAAGDLLVTSDQPGVAMRSEPIDVGGVKIHRPGTLIGKALEPLQGGEGEILVLLSLQ